MSELFAVVGHFLRPLSYSILCKSADFKMPWQAIETLHASCGDTFFVLMFIWFSAWPLHFAFPIFLFAATSQQLVANTGNFVPPACLGFPSFSFAIPSLAFLFLTSRILYFFALQLQSYSTQCSFSKSVDLWGSWAWARAWEVAGLLNMHKYLFGPPSVVVVRHVRQLSQVSPRSICSSSASFMYLLNNFPLPDLVCWLFVEVMTPPSICDSRVKWQ